MQLLDTDLVPALGALAREAALQGRLKPIEITFPKSSSLEWRLKPNEFIFSRWSGHCDACRGTQMGVLRSMAFYEMQRTPPVQFD